MVNRLNMARLFLRSALTPEVMFKKVLVANRGEIALRIICACKELGIETVAVYSVADSDSLHARFADEAICIGPSPSSESYLNIPSIISAAEIADVDAIHPGYGYLAESGDFADVCETCGIKFIGPSAASIELMGDKAKARETMQNAGLPIIPGSGVVEMDPEKILALGKTIGYPMIVKASAGGGGRGMRIVHHSDDLIESVSTAQSEAQSAFGNAEVYLERYLINPRHIEFQILADEHGNVIHLGERECSIQRRHQKLIEESPSPLMEDSLRESIGRKICESVSSIGYSNAGTIELLFDDQGNYFFIEMNTRVQVEHPVTEAITGIDIVKEQLRIACGQPLRYAQNDIVLKGHSIECRVNAESPSTFRPSPGELTAYHPPGGPGIRVDSMAHSGMIVSPFYDSMIAKVIAYGSDRSEAVDRLARALDMFVIEGIETTIPLHKKIISEPAFIKGELSTSFLDDFDFSDVE